MITRTKQDWSPGRTVRVGFLALVVESVRAVVDGLPDIYTLRHPKTGARFEFIPHHGLTRIS